MGGGKMGGALAAGWRRAGLAACDLAIVEPATDRRAALIADGHPIVVGELALLPSAPPPRALVLAVKPQVMDEVAASSAEHVGAATLVLSIAAGKAIAGLERAFGSTAPIVRAMPNTPAAVGRGATVLCANAAAGEADRALAGALMAAVGEVHWIADEAQMHAVTALSGSGPAYVFLLIEAMAAAGGRLGLPAELAMRLARATVSGSGELARQEPAPAAELRRNVTSPGGTTQAALDVLMGEAGLGPLVHAAMAAAARRSAELA